MTGLELLQQIATLDHHSLVKLSTGPFRLKMGPKDARAAKLLLELLPGLADDETIGEALETLDLARWWLTFIAATNFTDKVNDDDYHPAI